MGQTLTHGVYLPDEGERNCYSGLAANWQILDNSVGTIAEHTSALAGKAPLVHTHTKADITDLFNSANTWSANNTFSAGAYFYNSDSTAATSTLNLRNSKVTKGGTSDNGSQIIQFLDKDNKFLSQITTNKALSGTTQLQFTLGNIDSNNNSITGSIVYSLAIDGTKQFIPGSNNTHDLGNSSYQWNNLYAKNYYYNGTAWGLDKSNTWSNYNSYSKGIELVGNRYAYILPEFAANYSGISILTNSFGKSVKFGSYAVDENSVVSLDTTLGFMEISAGLANDVNSVRIQPRNAAVAELGTSTNKWKTLNGINPGALSIFNPSASYDPIDIPTSWDTSGASWNTLNVSNLGDGWVCITYNNCSAGDYILVRFGGTSGTRYPSLRFGAEKNNDNKYYIYALFPVAKAFSNIYLEMLINSNANLVIHHYIPAYGTV